MIRKVALSMAALALLGAVSARAQDTTKAAPPAPAVDSNELWVGEWEFNAQFRDTSIAGLWRISYGGGRFSGQVLLERLPPSPISNMTVRDHFKNMSLTAYFNGDAYNFTGHLDNMRSVSGTLGTRAGIGRLRAQRRG